MEDTILVGATKESTSKALIIAIRRGRAVIYSKPLNVGKEKLSKVLDRMNGLEKLANLLLNQRIENVIV